MPSYYNNNHSAGVGRTGTLIALDILMDQARRRRAVDVLGTVVKIRKYRAGMVQTEVNICIIALSCKSYHCNFIICVCRSSIIFFINPSRLTSKANV